MVDFLPFGFAKDFPIDTDRSPGGADSVTAYFLWESAYFLVGWLDDPLSFLIHKAIFTVF